MTNVKTLTGQPGDHICDVANAAVTMARGYNCVVEVQFNNVALSITASDEADAIVTRYMAEYERQAEEYRNSPAGIAAAKRRADQLTRDQKALNALMGLLPPKFGSHKAALTWLAEFTPLADDIDIIKDYDPILRTLTASGYVAHDAEGLLKDVYKTDTAVFTRYLMGQAMDMMQRGMPPHPMIGDWCKDCLARM